MAERADGWYADPYGRHEARWMSGGTPTELVRDRGVQSYDPPPDEEPSQTPEAAEFGPTGGSHVAGPEIGEDEIGEDE